MNPSIIDLTLAVASLPVLAAALYLFFLTLTSGRRATRVSGGEQLRFDLVVPAHDEERGIASTLASLAALDWPASQRRIVVVADNCSDLTGETALAHGATVLGRDDPAHKGKGHALAHAFAWSLEDGFADAVVVVDADTIADRSLLRSFAARLARGAQAVQSEYGVRNPEDSWRTQLMAIAFAIFHRLRSLGRERLGLSCGLRGNGMCFTSRLLREVPYQAFSLVEDVEHGLRIGEAGHRVWYVDEARVLGEMVAGSAASASQRRRWEDGRRELRKSAPGLLLRALVRRDLVLLDLALDLLVPPLSRLVAFAGAGLVASLALALTLGVHLAVGPWSLSLVLLGVYVARGWQLSGSGLAGLRALLKAPAYLFWKLALRARPGSSWVRTARHGEAR